MQFSEVLPHSKLLGLPSNVFKRFLQILRFPSLQKLSSEVSHVGVSWISSPACQKIDSKMFQYFFQGLS